MRLLLTGLLAVLCGCVTQSPIDELPPTATFSKSVPVRLNPYDPQRVDPLREEFDLCLKRHDQSPFSC